jgi:hypothetical protein
MTRPIGLRIARAVARAITFVYPREFRVRCGDDFPTIADDRWRRERASGASAFVATLITLRMLAADVTTGRSALRPAAGHVGSRARWSFSIRDAIDRAVAHVRYAIRGLARAPLLVMVATVSVGIGIGANTAVFAAVDALLFAPPPGIANPNGLVDICRSTSGRGCDTLAYPTYLDARDRLKTLAGVYAFRVEPAAWSLGATDGARTISACSAPIRPPADSSAPPMNVTPRRFAKWSSATACAAADSARTPSSARRSN